MAGHACLIVDLPRKHAKYLHSVAGLVQIAAEDKSHDTSIVKFDQET